MEGESLEELEAAIGLLTPDEERARRVARAVAKSMETDLVTREYLDARLAELKGELKVWTFTTTALIVVVAGIVNHFWR
jgi:hypothetical protein